MIRRRPRKQRGLSLVELMISLALSSVVTVGVIQLFSANSESYNLLQGQSRMQESARFAMSFIGDSARSARYSGCLSSPTDLESRLLQTPYSFDMRQGIDAYNSSVGSTTWSPPLAELPRTESNTDYNLYLPDPVTSFTEADNGIDTTQIVTGTDVLTLRNMSKEDIRLSQELNNPSDPIRLGGTIADLDLEKDDIVMIHDCAQAILFRVFSLTNVNIGGDDMVEVGHFGETDDFANAAPALAVAGFDDDAAVSHVETNIFFIAPGSGLNSSGNSPLSLWRKRGAGAPVELVEGVENMQVLFGLDTDGDDFSTPNRYAPANEIVDWNEVATLRVTLVVNSVDEVGGTSSPTHGCVIQDCIEGETFDGLLRRSFTQTFHIRN